jgi:hypothetical protein
MPTIRITSKIVASAMVAEIAILTMLYLPAVWGMTSRFKLTEAIIITCAGFFSFGVATVLSLEAAQEFQKGTLARWAWLWLAASAGLSFFKRGIGSPLIDFFVPGYSVSPMRGLLDNMIVVPANLSLLAGLLALWWSIHNLELGFRVARRDYAGMLAVGLLFFTLLIVSGNLSQGQSPYWLSRVLQPMGLGLLGVCSALGIVLHRYAMQMGDGKLAVVTRWLMAYVVLRGVLVLAAGILQPQTPLTLDAPSDLDKWVIDMFWQIVQWCVALAAACRADLTVSAARELKRLREAREAVLLA